MIRRISALALAAMLVVSNAWADAPTLTGFFAASLKNSLDDVIVAWKQAGGAPVSAAYASSSVLAKQIEQAAPADIFISADKQWMGYLVQRKLVAEPRDLLGNRLVLIAGKGDLRPVAIKPGFDLAGMLGDGRLAVGDPTNVPAGLYARQALEKLGVWAAVEPKLAPAADVRAALALVSRGETALGIVYETDAKVDPNVRIAAVFPEDTHDPIVYPVAVTTVSKNPDADKFVTFLASPAARTIFEKYGFSVLVR